MKRSTLAEIRFGYGRHPTQRRDGSVGGLLADLKSRDPQPKYSMSQRFELIRALGQMKKSMKKGAASEMDVKAAQRKVMRLRMHDVRQTFLRPMNSPHGFKERLVAFWADHFTVSAKNQRLASVIPGYWHDAIRPHVGGRFSDMLFAVATHPAMLYYLDQSSSVGPNSRSGKRRNAGLNENLAREMLELHTLGVGGGYSQQDVTQLAELLTGLRFDFEGFSFNPNMAEPGAETILGKSYGGSKKANLSDIRAALDDLALHPETAAHLARKLVTHFVSDNPDSGLVGVVADAYRNSGGELGAMYRALLEDERAWVTDLQKVKPPFDFMVSALRVAQLEAVDTVSDKDIRQGLIAPLLGMGQPFMRPQGPDGWPEDSSVWITPATLASRIEWVTALAREYLAEFDPRDFVDAALGDAASDAVRFAAKAAESKWEGVAIVLASPEFNRR